jgi:excinuclease ABC subunit C
VVLALLVRAGLVTGSREYYFPEPPAPDELLPGFVKQYYVEGRPVADEILLPGDIADRRLLAEVLSEQKGGPVRLMAASRGERGRLLALAGDNARAAWERRRPARSPEEALADLKTRLRLPGEAHRLEGVDISTLQGSQSVGGLVRFIDGEPDKSGYRRFRIKGVAGQDDYAMLAEVVRRHYGKPGQARPDLLVVDGGRGQLAAVLEALKDAGAATFPVVALAKETEQAGQRVRDRVFLPGRKNPRFLPPNSPGLLLLLRLRDEAHRFAISYHRKRARKELLTSELRQIPGIGPVRLKRLLQHFPNLEVLKSATLEDLSAVPGFNRGVAEKLKEWILEEGQEAQERV